MLSFPVCNCFKSLTRIRPPHRHTDTHSPQQQQQQRGMVVKRPLAAAWLCGIYFLSRNMTWAGCELSTGSINTPAFSSCHRSSSTPTVPSCRKEKVEPRSQRGPFLKSHRAARVEETGVRTDHASSLIAHVHAHNNVIVHDSQRWRNQRGCVFEISRWKRIRSDCRKGLRMQLYWLFPDPSLYD